MAAPSVVSAQVTTAGCSAALNPGEVRKSSSAVHFVPAIELNCNGTSEQCLPGNKILGTGYNAVYSTPVDVINNQGTGRPPLPSLVTLTWPSSTTCPGCSFSTSYNTYLVPEGVTVTDTAPGDQADILTSSSYTSYGEYYAAKQLSTYVGVESPWVSGSVALNDVRTSLDCEGKTVTSTLERVTVYNLTLEDNPTLDPEFLEDMQALPAVYEGNESDYIDFIEDYGTHFYKSLWLGGVLAAELDIEASYAKGKSSSQIEAQAQAQYFSVSGSSQVDSSERTMSQQFQESVSHRYMTLGGSQALPFPGDQTEHEAEYAAWKTEVRTNPVIARTSVEPIWDLIPDSVATANPNLEANLQSGVQAYLVQEIARLGILPNAPTAGPIWAGAGHYWYCGREGNAHTYAYSCVAQLNGGAEIESPLSPSTHVESPPNDRDCWGNSMELPVCPATTVFGQEMTVTGMRLYRMDTGAPQYVRRGPDTAAEVTACLTTYGGEVCWVGDTLGP
ncbi:MAC/perforin domain-containing protein [Nisaea sediminum]|uniref:MAC/perforin domain-containing protein n=1 Tax=Nisaea sediminum TaxID=2775867 RepID=UPI001865BA52|nr:MAC/perforin domain-containing protein [Nisaea sediminum]